MNELESLNEQQVDILLMNIKAYQKGCRDTYIVVKETHEDVMKFYDKKINECEIQLIKLRMTDRDAANDNESEK